MSHIFFKTRIFLNTTVVVFLLPFSAHGQYLMVEALQEELMCRAAVQSCLQSIKCTSANVGQRQYCWQNQCSVKEHLTYGDGKKTQNVKKGSTLSSSLESPFLMDPEAAVFRARILDCEEPVSAKAIVKASKSELDKPALAPTVEAASFKK